MTKRASSFVERLYARAAENRASRLAHRATVLAARDDIEAALREGFPMSEIWEALCNEGRISCTLPWFRKLICSLQIGSAAVGADVSQGEGARTDLDVVVDGIGSVAPASEPTRPTRFHHPESPDAKDYL